MKKILSMLLVLFVLVGCMPTHNTEAAVMFEEDFSGEVVLKVELETEYLEDPVSEIEEKITDIVSKLEQFKEGTFKTKNTSKSLNFTYTEEFKDLEELSEVLSRLYDEDIEITMETSSNLFKEDKYLEGFDFNAKEFVDPIYEIIEKEELFKENSKEARSSQEGSTTIDLYLDGEYVSYYDNFSNEVSHHINKDTLFIKLIDKETVNLMNVIELSDGLDLDELEAYYQTKFKTRILSDESKAKMLIDKDVKTHSLTVTLENVRPEHVEDLEYDIFDRMIDFEIELGDKQGKNDTFELEIFDMGHTTEFSEIVLEQESNLDISGHKILKVDDEIYDEREFYEFDVNGSLLTFAEDSWFTLTLAEDAFAFGNILNYIVYGLLAVLIAIALFFVFKNKSKNNKDVSGEESSDEGFTKVEQSEYELKTKDRVIRKNSESNFFKEFQNAIFNINALRHTAIMVGVLFIVTLIVMVLRNVIFGSSVSEILSSEYMMEFGIENNSLSIFKTLQLFFAWISTGGLSLGASSSLGSVNYAFSPYVNPLIITLLIPVVATFISLKITVKEDSTKRNINILSGTLWYGIIILILSYIPIITNYGYEEIFSIGTSVNGNSLSAGIIILPLYIFITYVIITYKQYFSTKSVSLTKVFYEGFKKFIIFLAVCSGVAFVFVMLKQEYPFIFVLNIAGYFMMLASGMIFETNSFMEYSEVGILNPDANAIFIVLGLVIYIALILYNMKAIYKRNNLVNKNRFTIVYTLAFTIPMYLFMGASMIVVKSFVGSLTLGMNFGTLLLSFVITLLVIFIRVQMIQEEHPQEHEVVLEEQEESKPTSMPETSEQKVVPVTPTPKAVETKTVQVGSVIEEVPVASSEPKEVVAPVVEDKVEESTEEVIEAVEVESVEPVQEVSPVEKDQEEVEVEDVEIENIVIEDENPEIKKRPMSGRRHRRRK